MVTRQLLFPLIKTNNENGACSIETNNENDACSIELNRAGGDYCNRPHDGNALMLQWRAIKTN